MAQDLSRQLEKLAKAIGVSFSLHNNPISYAEVFSEKGLLPAMARRADQLCSLCLGYGIGVTFEETEGALLGTRVVFDDVTPVSLRYLCIVDVIYEMQKASAAKDVIPLDQLLYD